MARLLLIGAGAGVFSAVFGVGGGLVLVPALMLLMRFDAFSATATSSVAILFTAVAGVAAYAVEGEVRPGYALLVGVPAVAGAVIGSRVKDVVSGRSLTLGFAGLLACVGVWLLVG